MTLKANEIKKALDPHIKRASQTQVKKIRNTIKQNQMKNMPNPKKETEPKVARTFDDLSDIVKIKKQKAVINELDSLVYDQTEEKAQRTKNINIQSQNPQTPTPMATFLSQNPEKVKDMSLEEVTKLQMLSNPTGNSNPYSMMMGLAEMLKNNNSGNGSNELIIKMLGMMMEKVFNNNGGSQKIESSPNNKFMEYMMQQNLKTQEMLVNILVEKKNTPVETQNPLIEKLFGMMKSQNDMENTFLKDKIREMEVRIQPTDSLTEAGRMFEFLKTFKGILGGSPQTEASMTHELKTKQMDFDQAHQVKEENLQTERMNSIGDMVNNAIKTFGDILGEPIAEAAKTKIEQFTESAKHPTEKKEGKRISQEVLRQEIDLGDIEKIEDEITEFSERPKSRSSRFRVSESGN